MAKNYRQSIPSGMGGFTLIEMLVVMSIIGIFSSFLVVNFRSQENQRQLKNGALALLDGIKKTQTLALSGSTLVGDAIGYGLIINNPSYTFNNGKPNCSFGCIYAQKADGSLDHLETLSFPSVLVDNDAFNLQVNFSLPRGNLSLSQAGTNFSQYTIKLYHLQADLKPYCLDISAVSGSLAAVPCP